MADAQCRVRPLRKFQPIGARRQVNHASARPARFVKRLLDCGGSLPDAGRISQIRGARHISEDFVRGRKRFASLMITGIGKIRQPVALRIRKSRLPVCRIKYGAHGLRSICREQDSNCDGKQHGSHHGFTTFVSQYSLGVEKVQPSDSRNSMIFLNSAKRGCPFSHIHDFGCP